MADDLEEDFQEAPFPRRSERLRAKRRKHNSGESVIIPAKIENPDIQQNENIWYCVSKFIEPIDVGRFALICRTTARITNSIQFWQRIYSNYCREPANLKELSLKKFEKHVRHIESVGTRQFRKEVIRMLFKCNKPLRSLPMNFSIDDLLGYTFVKAIRLSEISKSILLKFVKKPKRKIRESDLTKNSEFALSPDIKMLILYGSMSSAANWSINVNSEPRSHGLCLVQHKQEFTKSGTQQFVLTYRTSDGLLRPVKFQIVKHCIVRPWWSPTFRLALIADKLQEQ